jgi:hypothetical protein
MARNDNADNEQFINIVLNNFPDVPVFEVQDIQEDALEAVELPDNMFDSGFVVLPMPLEVLHFWKQLLGNDDDMFDNGNDV